MAFPLPTYKTIPVPEVPGVLTSVYTAPPGQVAIILTAHATNLNALDQDFTINHKRGASSCAIAYEYTIPSKEILYVSGGNSGSLVLESGDSIEIVGSSNDLAFIMSVMEQPQ